MKRYSVAKTILAILWDIGKGSYNAFYPHKYAKKYCYSNNRNTYRTSISRLQKNGYVNEKGNIFYLTSKGEKEAFFAFINAETKMYVNSHKNWDGHWRIIFFDIPEKKRKHRDYLRLILRTIGFREFQKSIWIYPHKIPSFLKELLFEENIKHYTRFITTTSIEYDKDLRKVFKV